MKNKVDYIIVGRGIAGSVLAYTLLQRGKTVLIIDENKKEIASRVAAGLYNPVVFKRLVKSWMADELIPFMDNFYSSAEKTVDAKFYHKKKIVKLFTEENEKDFWIKKTKEEVGKYLSNTIDTDFLSDIIYSPLGAAEVLSAGNLDTGIFLDAFYKYFESKESCLNEKVDYASINIADNRIDYKNYTAKKIIFCEGYQSIHNPYFNYLPFKLTKGEVLTVSIPKLSEANNSFEKVINKGCFILPVGNNLFKVGATYEWTDLTENTTEKGKNELAEKLKKVLKVPFEIIEHKAGIRPTVSDRRPLLGLHPQHPELAVFNGLGTKGVMLAPYFANYFAGFLENKNTLDKEVNIDRFK